MNVVNTNSRWSKRRKSLAQAAVGAVFGGGSMLLMLNSVDRADDSLDSGRLITLATALVYFLTGALVLVGAIFSRFGALALNVEDETEIEHERGNLLLASTSILAVAIGLGALALMGGSAPVIDESTAAVLIVGAALFTLITNIAAWRSMDELTLAMTKDASVMALTAVGVIYGAWAILAVFGRTAMFEPLDFVGGLFALYLICVFIAAARRGALSPP